MTETPGVGAEPTLIWMNNVRLRGSEVFEALVRNERRIELCFEGQRFYDPRPAGNKCRTAERFGEQTHDHGDTDPLPEVEKRSYASQWLPIPYTEKTTMKNMLQNEG